MTEALRDHLGHPVPCGQEDCDYGVQQCHSCPDNPDRGPAGDGFGMAVDAAMRQSDRVALLACRLVEEGLFEDVDAAIAWADSESEGGVAS